MTKMSIPNALRAGRRALEGVQGIRLLGDPVWDDLSGKWVLQYELVADVAAESSIPKVSEWYVIVDDDYPWGDVGYFPSKENGLEGTHHHQNYNGKGKDSQPWRTGKLCLDTTVRVLGRQAIDMEPFDSDRRLLWHGERALAWLSAASRYELVQPGEPFELPIFPGASVSVDTVAFSEDTQSYEIWQNIEARAGTVDMLRFRNDPDVYIIRRFVSLSGEALYTPTWGQCLGKKNEELLQGIWFLLDSPPVLPPWQAPVTWSELRRACDAQGLDILELLESLARHLRDGRRHIALLGFPIPERVGESPRQIHWQSIMLPLLSTGNKTAKGFRPRESGYWQLDRTEVLVDECPIDWLESENWSGREVSRRGRLPDDIAKRKILVLGGGAIGSAFAEVLVRGGVEELVIMDDDLLRTGNLVRHTLSLSDIGASKSESLAEHLNLCSPQAVIIGHNVNFPPKDGEHLAHVFQSQVIVDCTASDEVLHHMELFEWLEPKLFLSIWLGIGAKRLFCFSIYGDQFPHRSFRELVSPWLTQEFEEYGEELPREGIGCWHPVFPARTDDVWLMASVAAKHLLNIAGDPPEEPQLIVYEQGGEDGALIGLRKVASERG